MSSRASQQCSLPWQISMPRSQPREVTRPGKNFRHGIVVAMAAQGDRAARAEWMTFVGPCLRRTLYRLLGPAAPMHELVERAMTGAATSWPEYRLEEPVSIWALRIAVEVATGHLREGAPVSANASHCFVNARAGGVREVLASVYERMQKTRPEEQVAFALLELDGRSLSETAAVLRVSPMVVRQRAARVRRHLLYAARGDRLIARYLRIAARLAALARRLDHGAALT